MDLYVHVLSLNSLQLVKSNIARRFRGEIARRKEGTRGALSSGKDGLAKGDGEGAGGGARMSAGVPISYVCYSTK